jgi:pimeloyl-ACP methyl ester carboxylesterase
MLSRFEVNISQDILDDLKIRLKNTRWPDEIEGSKWTYGADLSYMMELADYWLNEYDWRKTEQEINNYDNFIAKIDGYKIHFLHVKGKGEKSLPIIITHGWPSSFLEMLKLIPFLTEKDNSFDLVIPSMMGFGFSQKITHPDCNIFFMADLWVKMMK